MFEGRHIDYRSSKVDTSITDLRRSTHRSSVFEGRHINHRSSKVDTSIIGLRRSTHPSPKVDTSIFESQHIDLRRSTHRDLDLRKSTHLSSIFESRRIDLRRSKAETSHLQFVVEYCPQLRSYISSWSRPRINDRLSTSRRSYTRSYIRACIKINNI